MEDKKKGEIMSEMKRLPGFLLLRWKTADRNHLADVNYDCLYLFFFFAFFTKSLFTENTESSPYSWADVDFKKKENLSPCIILIPQYRLQEETG